MSIEENKAIVRRCWEEVWNKKNLNALDEYLDENYVGHTRGQRGIEEAKAAQAKVFKEYPDIGRIETEDIFAEGDKVAWRWTLYAKGKAASTGITINRIVGGKIADDWFCFREIEG
jgi:predicted ester cyclase